MAIIDNTVDLSLSMTFSNDIDDTPSIMIDHIMEYACEVVSLGLLFLNYRDAIKEGDGERVILCWKYMLLIFKATNRSNYAVEACHLLADHIKVLPPRQAHQLVWSRFVNVHGKPGCNIPCDLYMEHMNRLCQDCIRHLGANKTKKAICRPSKCMSFLSNIIDRFNKEHKCYITIHQGHIHPYHQKRIVI